MIFQQGFEPFLPVDFDHELESDIELGEILEAK